MLPEKFMLQYLLINQLAPKQVLAVELENTVMTKLHALEGGNQNAC